MLFPDNYPLNPPTCRLSNLLRHPNVFDEGEDYYICLDMLNTGWSAAYSISSVLLQLLSFLITDKAPQEYGDEEEVIHSEHDIKEMTKSSHSFVCSKCKHSFKEPFPPINNRKNKLHKKEEKVEEKKEDKKKKIIPKDEQKINEV